MTTMFVNLPVTDLERAKTFWTAIGFTINPLFTDPDGNVVDLGWMDPVAAEQGPAAFAEQQA